MIKANEPILASDCICVFHVHVVPILMLFDRFNKSSNKVFLGVTDAASFILVS